MITEKISVGGIAVRPGISLNGINYTVEELNKFGPTMKNKPILKDHRSETDNTIGLIEDAESNGKGVISWAGWIKEDGSGISEKLNDGRVKEVSIGAFVEKLVRENDDDEYMTAIGIHSMELSTTPTPAVKGTSIKQTLESIKNKKTDSNIEVSPIFEDVDKFKEIDSTIKTDGQIIAQEALNVGKTQKITEGHNMGEETKDEIETKLREKIAKEKDSELKYKEQVANEIKEKLEQEIREKIIKESEEEDIKKKEDEETKEKFKLEIRKEYKAEIE